MKQPSTSSSRFLLTPDDGDPRFVDHRSLSADAASEAMLLNPPDRSQLIYRVGTYGSFLAEMSRILPQVEGVVSGQVENPLSSLNTQASGEWVSALLSSWAEVADILSFYQERLINEGFLGTAVEPSSKRLMLQAIGATPGQQPAAETHLSFQITPTPSGFEQASKLAQSIGELSTQGPASTITVPSGTQAATVPTQNRSSQTFETTEDLEAHSQFNQLKPAITDLHLDQKVRIGATQLRLKGTQTGLKQGQPILIVGGTPGAPSRGASSARYIRLLTSVEPQRQAGYTLVAWQEPLRPKVADVAGSREPGPAVLRPTVIAFKKSLPLFGYNAKLWKQLSPTQKAQYAPIQGGVWALGYGHAATARGVAWNQGLPLTTPSVPLAVTAFAVIGDQLFGATPGQGIFSRKLDRPLSPWQPAGGSGSGLTRRNVQSLIAVDGVLYAGSVGGVVFSSVDSGRTWDQITGGPPTVTGTGDNKQVVSHALPNTVVRALGVPTGYGSPPAQLYAGTDQGLYAFDGVNWSPELGPGSVPQEVDEPVHALIGCSAGLVAGTGDSVLVLETNGSWSPIAETWSGGTAQALAAGPATLWAGTTAQGLWSLVLNDDQGTQPGAWSKAKLPVDDPSVTAVVVLDSGAVVAGTSDGLLLGSPDGVHWEELSWDVPGQRKQPSLVSALAAMAEDRFLVASPFNGFAVHDWPHFHLPTGTVELAQIDQKIVAGGWVVLQQGGPSDSLPSSLPAESLALAEPVLDASTVYGDAFGIQGQHTSLSVDPRACLEEFDLRTADAWVESRSLELFDQEVPMPTPVSGSVVTLAQPLTKLLSLPRPVVVLGRALDVGLDTPGGVFIPAARGETQGSTPVQRNSPWRRLGPVHRDVRALLTDDRDLLIGTFGQGIYSASVVRLGWPRKLPHQPGNPRVYALARGSYGLAAGTDNGIWLTASPTAPWQGPILAGEQVLTLLTSSAGGLLAGSESGRLYSLDLDQSLDLDRVDPSGVDSGGVDLNGGSNPKPIATFEGAVQALLQVADLVWVGTSRGVFTLSFDGAGGTWSQPQPADTDLGDFNVRALSSVVLGRRPTVVAGTAGGVFAQTGSDGAWAQLGTGLGSFVGVPPSVRSLAVGGPTLWAGLQGDGLWQLDLLDPPADRRWQSADFGASNDPRCLWIPTAPTAETPIVVGCGNDSVVTGDDGLRRLALKQEQIVATPADAPSVAALDQGNLPSTLATDLQQQQVDLKAPLVIETRCRGRAWRMLQGGRNLYFLWLQDGQIEVYTDRKAMRLMSAPGSNVGAVYGAWRLADDEGFEGSLWAYGDELAWLTSSSSDPKTGELAVVEHQLPGATSADPGDGSGGPSRLVLRQPLTGVFDAAATVLLANTAHATHGSSTQQIMGSGNASLPNQSFTLRQPAIDWLDPRTGQVSSTLEVRVDGVLWTAVRSFADAACDSRVYVIRTQADGRQVITFGDGHRGARLPTGLENVVAGYRTAITRAGSSTRGAVQLPTSRPVGLRSVDNPLPADFPTVSSDRVDSTQLAPSGVSALGSSLLDLAIQGSPSSPSASMSPAMPTSVPRSISASSSERSSTGASTAGFGSDTAVGAAIGPARATASATSGTGSKAGATQTIASPTRQGPAVPSFVRTLNRAVSINDLAEVAAASAGITDALVRTVVIGGRRAPLLTVAPDQGKAFDVSSSAGSELTRQLSASGLAGVQPVLVSYQPVFFDLVARVEVAAPEKLFQTLIKSLLGALVAEFGFGKRLADPVAASAVIDTLQARPEVVSVDLKALYRHGRHPSLNTVLAADTGSWDPVSERTTGAEMLIVNTPNGAHLQLESTI